MTAPTIWETYEFSQFSCDERTLLLYDLSYFGFSDWIELLTRQGVDVDFRSHDSKLNLEKESLFCNWTDGAHPGSTPIGNTILGSVEQNLFNLSALRVLLSAGADPNRNTYSGYTPLQLSIISERPEFFGQLLLWGADPYATSTDFDRPTSFDLASDCQWANHMLQRWQKEQKAS